MYKKSKKLTKIFKMKKSTLLFIALIHLFSFQLLAQKTKVKNEEVKSSLSSYEKYIKANNETHLKEFMELIAIPSISSIPSNKPDVERAATWIVNKMKSIGITTAQTIPTGGHPVVYGSWEKAPGKPTVLIYFHYDVQPVKELECTISHEKLHSLINKYLIT